MKEEVMQQKHDQEASKIQDALIARWEVRQAELADLLEECGATNGERHVDWEGGQLEWLNIQGERVATCKMKALCSYSYVDESLMMAWANVEIDEAAVIAPQPNMPEYIESCNIAEAWFYAMHLAEESQADYLYRIASPRYLVFLGLWNLQPIMKSVAEPIVKLETKIEQADKIPVPLGSPHAFVVGLLHKMRLDLEEKQNEPIFLRQHFINHGESLWQNAQYLENDGADSELLRYTSNALIKIGNSFGQRRFRLLPPASLSEEEMTNIVSELADLHTNWAEAARQYRARIK